MSVKLFRPPHLWVSVEKAKEGPAVHVLHHNSPGIPGGPHKLHNVGVPQFLHDPNLRQTKEGVCVCVRVCVRWGRQCRKKITTDLVGWDKARLSEPGRSVYTHLLQKLILDRIGHRLLEKLLDGNLCSLGKDGGDRSRLEFATPPLKYSHPPHRHTNAIKLPFPSSLEKVQPTYPNAPATLPCGLLQKSQPRGAAA